MNTLIRNRSICSITLVYAKHPFIQLRQEQQVIFFQDKNPNMRNLIQLQKVSNGECKSSG